MNIQPFTVRINQQDIEDLKSRLRQTRWPEELPAEDTMGAGAELAAASAWVTGVPQDYLRGLVEEWANDFDWRAEEELINSFPNFSTEIEGQKIHFIHRQSSHPDAIPLLVTHGWPGSFLEFLHLIEPLTEPEPGVQAFHLVIPSLPGFGFSTPLRTGGWNARKIARDWAELMSSLGYQRFVVQGGDIGAGVAPEVARQFPERVIGVHVNGPFGYGQSVDEETRQAMSSLEQDRLQRIDTFMRDEIGYIAIQSTRPGLIGVALADSPVAQLAWILDKLKAWTFPASAAPDEVLGSQWILSNVSLYWFTRSAGSAALVGYASTEWGAPPISSGVPTAAIQFAHDVGIRQFAEQSNNIVRWTDVADRGGHFAALEQPAMLLQDLREFLADLAS